MHTVIEVSDRLGCDVPLYHLTCLVELLRLHPYQHTVERCAQAAALSGILCCMLLCARYACHRALSGMYLRSTSAALPPPAIPQTAYCVLSPPTTNSMTVVGAQPAQTRCSLLSACLTSSVQASHTTQIKKIIFLVIFRKMPIHVCPGLPVKFCIDI